MKERRALLGRRDAALHLGIPPRTLYALTTRGEIPGVRIGRVLKFEQEALDAWLRGRATACREVEPEPVLASIGEGQPEPAERALLRAILVEQRETRRLLVRWANRREGVQP